MKTKVFFHKRLFPLLLLVFILSCQSKSNQQNKPEVSQGLIRLQNSKVSLDQLNDWSQKGNDSLSLAIFVADWCPRSNNLLLKFVEVLKSKDYPLRPSVVNVSGQTELSQANGIFTTPSVKFYHQGQKIFSFTGELKTQELSLLVDSLIYKLTQANHE